MRPARGTARVNERLTQLLGVPCVGIKAIVDVIAADRGCREHIRAALLQRQRGELLVEPPIANPFPTRPPSTISPKPRQPGFPVAPVPPVRPMPAKPLADLPDVSDDATALSHADVVALVAARLSEGEQLEGASQRAKAGSGAVAGAVGGQTAPSPAAAVPVAAVPVAAPSAAAIAAVPAAPAAVSVAPCEALQRRKGLL